MKVVQINATCDKGGTGKMAWAVSELLNQNDIENYILYSCGQSDYKNGIKFTTMFSIKLHALISRIVGNYGFDNKKATKKLISHLSRIKPDIIHIHNIHSHDCDLTMLFGYIRDNHIKVFWTFHDCWTFTGYCPYFDMAGCDQWKKQCHNCPQMKRYSWFFDRSKENYEKKRAILEGVDVTVITPSQWLCDLVKQSFWRDCPVKVINNGIDLTVFKPRESSFREKHNCQDKYILLGVSYAWEKRKGLDVFIRLAEQLGEKYQIVLIGVNQTKQLPNNIISIPRINDQTELAEIYTAADLFVNPTREENYPTVNMEALACGTPVLTFQTGGSAEMIDETCGTSVPKDDIEYLHREIIRISETKPYTKEACLQKAKSFDKNDRFKEYIAMFKEQERILKQSNANCSCNNGSCKGDMMTASMRIVQINAVCDTGSTGRICKELNDTLMQNGHQGVILYGNGSSQYPYGKKVEEKIGVKLHGFLSRVLGKNAAYSPIATQRAIQNIKTFRPDVVHLHNLHGNYINLKPLLSFLAKKDIPTVVTLHDCWMFTGKCTHYTQTGCDKWQTGCYDCPRLKKDIPSLFFDRTSEMWKEKNKGLQAIPRLAVIGVSDWITEEGKKSPVFAKAKIVKRIYNWIDLEIFYPRQEDVSRQYGIDNEKPKVLCVGAGWGEQADKTKDLMILAEKLGDAYQILLVGNVACAERFPTNVKHIGYIRSAEELAKLYSVADVYVHLSREDTFGKVIAEAMACGTPTVVYDATACPELVADGCGCAVKTGDTDALAAAVKRIIQQGKMAYSQKCVENVRQRFAKEKLIQETIDLYEALIGSGEELA